MNVDPEEIRRWYAALSDEALFSVDHRKLTNPAQQIYGQELASRGLQPRPAPSQVVDDESPLPDLALMGTFLYPVEAKVARALLVDAGIPCYLQNEHTLSAVWSWAYALGGFRLVVPKSNEEQALALFKTTLDDKNANIPAESGPVGDESESHALAPPSRADRILFVLVMFLFAATFSVNYLSMFYVW